LEAILDDFRRHEASEHYERAIALERAGRIDEAIIEYRRAVDVDPGFAEAYEALGHHYRRRGLLTKALDAFVTVVNLEANYTRLFNLGYILVELERYEEALEVFHRCLELVPDDPTAWYEIGFIYYAMGQLDEAMEALRIPRQVYPEDWRVLSLFGACYLGLSQWKRAEEHYQRALVRAMSPKEAQEAESGLSIARRYQEFPPDYLLNLKDQAYADEGIILLGTKGDDGLNIGSKNDWSMSAEAVATTLHRLRALLEALNLELTAVVAVDRSSVPLIRAMGQIFSLPRKHLSELQPNDRALLGLIVGRQAELLQVAEEQTSAKTLSLAIALNWLGNTASVMPDLTGVFVHKECSPPWQEGMRDAAEIEAAVKTLISCYDQLPEEANLKAQIDYYTRKHPHLRFLQ
jgi:tetratricopeptide (TPR) repeat protein